MTSLRTKEKMMQAAYSTLFHGQGSIERSMVEKRVVAWNLENNVYFSNGQARDFHAQEEFYMELNDKETSGI